MAWCQLTPSFRWIHVDPKPQEEPCFCSIILVLNAANRLMSAALDLQIHRSGNAENQEKLKQSNLGQKTPSNMSLPILFIFFVFFFLARTIPPFQHWQNQMVNSRWRLQAGPHLYNFETQTSQKCPCPPPKKRQRCGEDPKQSFLRSTNSGTFPFVLVFYHTPINRLPFFTHPPVQHVQLTRLFLFFLLFFRLWTIRLALEMKSPWKNGASLREFPNHSHPNHLGSVTLLLGLEDLACAAFHRCNFEKICWEILKIITPNCDVCVLSAIEFALRQGSIDVRCCWFTILGTFPGTLAFLCMQVSCNNLHLAV